MATGSPVEVAPNVYSVPVGEGGNNVYMVVGERAVFIDSGHDEDDEVSALEEALNNWEETHPATAEWRQLRA